MMQKSLAGETGTLQELFAWGDIKSMMTLIFRMLGFDGAFCATHSSYQLNYSAPIWMDRLQCLGNEIALDYCPFDGWGIHHCNSYYGQDAGVVCKNGRSINYSC